MEWVEKNNINLGSLIRSEVSERMRDSCDMCGAYGPPLETVPIDVATELGYEEPFEACRECREDIKTDLRGEA